MTDGYDKMRVLNKEGSALIMGNKDAVKKYQSKMDEFKIRPSAEEGRIIRKYAADTGASVQGLFLEAVREYMERHTLNIEEGTQ